MAISLDATTVAQVERVLARDRVVMPLPEALTRRLGVESWMLTLGPDGKLRAITVLADTIDPAIERTVAIPEPRPLTGHPLDRALPLPPTGALARVLGAPTATGRQLADLALRQDDPELRGEAVRVAVDAMMRDPALESALLGALDGLDDDALARVLESVAGDAAPGLVALVAERARGRPLGRRATAVLTRFGAR